MPKELRETLESDAQDSLIAMIYGALSNLDFGSFDRADISKRFLKLADKPGEQTARRILLDAVIDAGLSPCQIEKTGDKACDGKRAREALSQVLRRAGDGLGVRTIERPNRNPDEALSKRRRDMCEFLYGAIKHARQETNATSGMKKSDKKIRHAFVDTYSRKTALREKLNEISLDGAPTIREQAEQLWGGPLPCFETILRWFTEFYGSADRLSEYDRYVQQCLGWKASWAGQAMFIDATTYAVTVDNAFGVATTKGKSRRWAAHFIDAASGMHHAIVAPQANSEADLWNKVSKEIFMSLTWAPEFIFCDGMSHLFNWMFSLRPGEKILERASNSKSGFTLGMLGILACGPKLKIKDPRGDEGNAFGERGIGVAKDHLYGLIEKQASQLERAGRLPGGSKRRRGHYTCEAQFQKVPPALKQLLSALENFRESGCSRQELFNLPASVQKRQEYALVPDTWGMLTEIAPRVRIGALYSSDKLLFDGGAPIGHLNEKISYTPECDEDGNEIPLPVLIIPGGMRSNDASGSWRYYVMNKQTKAILCVDGQACTRDQFGYPDYLTPLGSEIYRAKPETEAEQKRHAGVAAAAKYAELLPEQNQQAPSRRTAPAANLETEKRREETAQEKENRLAM